jgi:hypothetical protein
MCVSNKRKIDWYLSRSLAVEVPNVANAIRLLFEPRGLGNHGDNFYLETKSNICVACGVSKSLIRHSIVPHSFRTHFPGI